MEEIGHLVRRRDFAIDVVLRFAPDGNLTRDGNFFAVVVPDGRVGSVAVVEDDGDGGLGDARLALFVDELGQVPRADLGQVRDSQNEADGVEDVGFAGAVQARDCVEVWVESDCREREGERFRR